MAPASYFIATIADYSVSTDQTTTDKPPAAEVRAPTGDWWRSGAAWLTKAWRAGLGLLYPADCLRCEKSLSSDWSGPRLCDDCRGELWVVEPRCPKCAAQVPAGNERLPQCVRCRGRRWYWERTVAMGRYTGALRSAVLRIKSGDEEPLAMALGDLMADSLAAALADEKFTSVVPIPLHWTRRWHHGGNSAEILAECLAARLEAPLANDGLVRVRATPMLSEVTLHQRAGNLRGALAPSSDFDFQGAHVLLIDDVLTSGSTTNEAARVLKEAGAERVVVAVMARAAKESV